MNRLAALQFEAVVLIVFSTKGASLFMSGFERIGDLPDSRRLGEVGLVYGYVSSPDPHAGWVLLRRANTLVANVFDARRLELTGQSTVVAEPVGTFLSLARAFSSANGVLVYGGGGSPHTQLTWMDRQGKVLGPAGEPGPYPPLPLALSPAGTRVAITRGHPEDANLWLLDQSRGSSSRLTFGSYVDAFAVWSPDGRRIAFTSTRGGTEPGGSRSKGSLDIGVGSGKG